MYRSWKRDKFSQPATAFDAHQDLTSLRRSLTLTVVERTASLSDSGRPRSVRSTSDFHRGKIDVDILEEREPQGAQPNDVRKEPAKADSDGDKLVLLPDSGDVTSSDDDDLDPEARALEEYEANLKQRGEDEDFSDEDEDNKPRFHAMKDPYFAMEKGSWELEVHKMYWYGDTLPTVRFRERSDDNRWGYGYARPPEGPPPPLKPEGNAVIGMVGEKLPSPRDTTFRVYISSNASDMVNERSIFHEMVDQKIRNACFQLGLDYQVLDYQPAISYLPPHVIGNAREDALKMVLGSKISTVVVLMGQLYGNPDVPVGIVKPTFERLIETAIKCNSEFGKLLEDSYQLDENDLPYGMYILKKEANYKTIQEALKEIFHATDLEALPPDVTLLVQSGFNKDIGMGILEANENYSTQVTLMRTFKNMPSYDEDPSVSQYCDSHLEELEKDNKAKAVLGSLRNSLREKLTKKKEKQQSYFYSYNRMNFRKIKETEVEWQQDGVNKIHSPEQKAYLETEVAQYLRKHLTNVVNQRGPEHINDSDRWNYTAKTFYQELLHGNRYIRAFCSATSLPSIGDQVDEILKEKSKTLRSIIVLHGQSSLERDCVLADAAKRFHTRRGENCAAVFLCCGSYTKPLRLHEFLLILIQQIIEVYDFRPPIPNDHCSNTLKLSRYLVLLLKKVSKRFAKKMPLLVLLGGLEHLSSDNNAHSLWWLPRALPPRIHLVASMKSDSAMMNVLTSEVTSSVHISPRMVELKPDSVDVTGTLANVEHIMQRFGRSLTATQKEIVGKSIRNDPSPLYTSLVMSVSMAWSSFLPEDKCIIPATSHAIVKLLVEKLQEIFGKVFISKALAYLTVSKNGLTELELQDLLSCSNDVMDEVYKKLPPPKDNIIRMPTLFLVRLISFLDPFLSYRTIDDRTVFNWNRKEFVEVATDLFIPDDAILHADFVQVLKAKAGLHKPIALSDHKLEIEAGWRQVSDNKLVSKSRVTQWKHVCTYDKRKLDLLPYHTFHLEVKENPACPKLLEEMIFNLEWMQRKMNAFKSVKVFLDDLDMILEDKRQQAPSVKLLRDSLDFCQQGFWKPRQKFRNSYENSEVLSENLAREIIGRFKHSDDKNMKSLVSQAVEWFHRQDLPFLYPIHQCFTTLDDPLQHRYDGPTHIVATSDDGSLGLILGAQFGLAVWSFVDNDIKQYLQRKLVKGDFYAINQDAKYVGLLDDLRVGSTGPGTHGDKSRPGYNARDKKSLIEKSITETLLDKAVVKLRTPKAVWLQLWDTPIAQALKNVPVVEKGQVECFILNAAGDRAVIGTQARDIVTVDLGQGKCEEVSAHEGAVLNLVLRDDDSLLISSDRGTAGKKSQVKLWIFPALTEKASIDIGALIFKGMLKSPKNTQVAVGLCNNNSLVVFDLEGQVAKEISGECRYKNPCIMVVDEDARVCITGDNKAIHLWNITKEEFAGTICNDVKGEVKCVALTKDSKIVVSGSSNGNVAFWDIEAQTSLFSFHAHTTAVTSIHLSQDDRMLHTTSMDMTLKTWNRLFLEKAHVHGKTPEESNKVGKEPCTDDRCSQVLITNDSKYAVTVTPGELPKCWDIETATFVRQYENPEFSPNAVEPMLLLGDEDKKVILVTPPAKRAKKAAGLNVSAWETKSGTLLQSFTEVATAIAPSPDGLQLVMGLNQEESLKLTMVNLTDLTKSEINMDHEADSVYRMLSLEYMDITLDGKYALLVFQQGKKVYYLTVDLESMEILKPSKEALESKVPDAKMDEPGPENEKEDKWTQRRRLREQKYQASQTFDAYPLVTLEASAKHVVIAQSDGEPRAVIATSKGHILIYDMLNYSIVNKLRTLNNEPIKFQGIRSMSVTPPNEAGQQFVIILPKNKSEVIIHPTKMVTMHKRHVGGLFRDLEDDLAICAVVSKSNKKLVLGYQRNLVSVGDVILEMNEDEKDNYYSGQNTDTFSSTATYFNTYGDVFSVAISPDENIVVALTDYKISRKPIFLRLTKMKSKVESEEK